MADRRTLTRIVAMVCAVLATSAVARAQTVDPAFDPGVSGSSVRCLVVQPDGKILVGGDFTGLGGGTGTTPRSHLGRVNADGSIDESFDPSPNYLVQSLALQPDGKILVAGEFTEFSGHGVPTPRNRLARLNADGTVDESFNPGANANVWHMALQPDGKIIVAGEFTGLGGGTGTMPQPYLGRLNADGSVDESFTPASPDRRVRLVALQADGKILVGGEFDHLGVEVSIHFGRLNSDGSLDGDFSAARDWTFTAENDGVHATAMQADGKILLGLRNGVLRVNPDGSLDRTFTVDTGLYLYGGYVKALVVQPNGRIVVGGWFAAMGRQDSTMYSRLTLGRLMEDGSIDHSFNPGTKGLYWYAPPSHVESVVAQPDGRLVVGGHFTGLGGGTGTTPRLSLGRLLADTTDAPFVAVQPSNQIVFAGAPATFHCEGFGFPEPTVQWIVRTGNGEWVDALGATATTFTFTATLADDGKQFRAVFSNASGVAMSDVATLSVSATGVPAVIDPEFTTGLPNGAYVDEIVVQPDGKILVLGAFDVIGESGAPVPRRGIARLNSDGSVDMAFNPATSGSGSAAALQADGKYVIAGGFVFQGNIARDGIARLHADGSVDLGFNPGTDDGGIGALAIQPDGKIVVGGTFRGLGGGTGATPRDRIGRINPDGSVDAAFNPGADLQVLCIALQPDGRILIGGQFTYVAGVQRPGLARLNADGSLDTSFNARLAPDGRQQVAHVVVQPDGRIVIGGGFEQIGGVPRNHIARLNADGSLDTGFDPGANDYVSRLLLQPDGKIIAAGSFTAFGGGGTGTAFRERIARVNPDGTLDALRAGANNYIRALAQQADWGLLVGGDFTRLNTETVTLDRRGLGRFLIGSAPAAAPSVRTQPANQSVTAGLTASFYADARGNPVPSAQWQVSIDNGVTWEPIPGATATTYAFTAALADSGRHYRAIFANDLGQATTNAASLTVNPTIAPAVTAQPISVSTRPGLRVTFSAAGTGDPPPTVRWQVSTNGGGSWADVPAATALVYSLTAALSDNGKWFRAVFTSIAGEAATDPATLTVRRPPVPGDFDGDGRTDVAVYRRETGVWFIGQHRRVQYGGHGYLPVPADFDGDGTTDIAVYQPSTGWWYVLGQTWVQFGDAGDVPVPGDYDGDGRADIAVYRPSTGEWFVRNQLHVQYGGPGYVPVPADYDGDLKTDIAVYRPAAGVWYVRDRFFMTFGEPGLDIPVPGDFNGDYVADFATYRPSTGWWQARSRTAFLFAITYGAPGDIPVAGNFDADADTDVAVYRPSSGHWFVRNQFTLQFGDAMDIPVPLNISLLSAVNGDYDGDRATDLAVYTAATGRWRVQNGADVVFGEPADKPVPADYDGNGSIDVAVWRPSTGTWYVRDQFTVVFGDAGDVPVPGDYDGDGLAEVAVYRPSTGFWYFHNQPAVHFGDSGDVPVPGDYNGDGKTEIAVYRPSTGYWYVRSQMAVQLGGPGLVPLPGDYNGDALTDVAVFDTATATWHIRGYPAIVFGDPADTPVPADYDGDGTTDIAVYRPSTGEWIVRNQFTIVFGDPGDVPVVRSGGIQ